MAVSNNIISTINFIALICSIPIIFTGIWLASKPDNHCIRSLPCPIVFIGVLFLLLALTGFIGAHWNKQGLLAFYLFCNAELIVTGIILLILAFIVTLYNNHLRRAFWLKPKVSSSESDIICVQGYNVKSNIAPILEAIFKKHGDIAAKCTYKIPSVRTSFLEVVCEVVKRIQTDDIKTIISEIGEIECQVSEAEAANVDVTWLCAYLSPVHNGNEEMKKADLFTEMKVNTILAKNSAEMDLKERCEELVAAQERVEKAERCVKVLDLVEKKLSNNILEAKTENYSWVKQPIL